MKTKTDNKIFLYILSVLLFIVILAMSVGYALYSELIPLNGIVTLSHVGNVEITNITLIDSKNITSSQTPTYSLRTANFNITFPKSKSASITYQIDLTNNTNIPYIYDGIIINASIPLNEGKVNTTISGINNGEAIAAGKTVTFTLTFSVSSLPQEVVVDIETIINGTTDNSGTFLSSITPPTGNLKSPNTMAHFTLSVINTYSYSRTFTLSLTNNNLILTDASGNSLNSLTIGANTEATYDVYIMTKEGAIFLTDTTTTNVLVYTSDIATITAGSLTLDVDIYEEPDTEPPILKNATLTMNNTIGSITADWSYKDTYGSSIESYTLLLYNSNGTLIDTINTSSNTYTFTNIAEGSYYYIVYGCDSAGNSGEEYTTSATTDEGYATKSNTLNAKWTYNVTTNLTNINFKGDTTVTLGSSYTATLSTTSRLFSRYYLPMSITITMNGQTLTNGTEYTYSQSTGEISIPNVTGDITISGEATSSCLAEGTQVLLANGTSKNIEDITYDDLLLVYNYETGKFTFEYPIWIEKKGTSNSYTISTFSDGTTLKTIGSHGIYSYDSHKFINVADISEYHIGTTVVKYRNGKLQKVQVTNIEYVNEPINYYHVVSSIYYNIISNTIMTTDGNINLVNMYNFDENITWQINRKLVLQDSSNLFTYEEVEEVMPKYMFIGLRANEVKWLLNLHNQDTTNISDIKDIITSLNSDILLSYPTINNDYYFNVSTSLNTTTKIKGGTTYTLPYLNPEKYIGWYSTIDNKIYEPLSSILINISTHFIAIPKE